MKFCDQLFTKWSNFIKKMTVTKFDCDQLCDQRFPEVNYMILLSFIHLVGHWFIWFNYFNTIIKK